MAPGITGTKKTAKEVLEEFGEQIQREAKKEALEHIRDLQEFVSHAKYNGIKTGVTNSCELDHNYESSVTTGHSNPCENRWDIRFSDIYEGQCTNKKIKGNDDDTTGACAPFRRLHVCDRNLEEIKPVDITNDKFLVDVLLAAKHEGQSIKTEYNEKNGDYKSGLCTILARSFADIGDIVRGKDLYLGNKKQNQTDREKERLQQNLRSIFAKIYGTLPEKKNSAYLKDGPNYYKLREHWWNANRQQIWNAIICDVPEDAKYLEQSDDPKSGSHQKKCRCYSGNVLTNFDYVPQYLRWFDEWSEEFCRLRRKKIEILEKICRGVNESGQPKYCSRNGCDCEQTINKIGHIRLGNGCTNCLFACNRYIDWINKKKDEFLKQKNKYDKVINGTYSQETGLSNNIINKYDNKFYEKLRNQYGSVDEFLNLLNKEKECLEKPQVKEEIKDINFSNVDDTFYRSKYCESCPQCGVVKNSDGTFRNRREEEPECKKEQPYKPSGGVQPTVIDVLSFGEEPDEIKKNIENFCVLLNSRNNPSLYEKWKCYYEKQNNEACILKNKNKSADQPMEIQKPFFDFFTYWVAHMLKDSVEWRTKVNRCLKNKEQLCINNCNRNCKCYEQWVELKKKEWEKIKEHYEKQKLPKGGHYVILERFLELEFIKGITNAYGEQKEVQRIAELLRNKTNEGPDDATQRKTIIDELLDHELEEAHECRENNPEEENCSKEPHDDLDDEDETHYNPCGKTDGTTVRAKQIAKKFQRDAKTQMKNNTRNDGTGRKGAHNSLVGDISKAYFKNGGQGSDLIGDKICNINTRYSNDDRTGNNRGPCTGKDKTRFDIGTTWETGGTVQMTETEAYMPPRRRHMCTSNLEKLHVDSVINNRNGGTPGDSLLGDILLAAKKEGDFIVEKLGGNDNSAICRSMKYSFADLGDIIRGRDMWDQEGGMKSVRGHLEKIFGTLHNTLPGIKVNDKYKGDEQKSPPYKKLREDWWEANRHQVWKAMKCAMKNGNIDKCNGIPLDDYIPQKLRWMTEWAEWYCKYQSKAYSELRKGCEDCRSWKCMKGDGECEKCKAACAKYTENIKKWEQQWIKMQIQYTPLYLQAKNDSTRMAFPGAGPDYKQVVDFLSKLHTQNSGNSIYESAAAYVHDTGNLDDCQKQDHFCEYKGGTPNGTENEKYAFRSKPYDHDIPCSCHERNKNDELCKMVKDLLKNNDGETTINGCNKKEDKDWTCKDADVETTHIGACMPPRRQSLCLHDLTVEKDMKDKHKLIYPFIRCVAKEIHFLWHKYKKHKIQDDKLKTGTIPEDFKRQMFYTFGDYRDILFDTDISAKSQHILKVQTNINNVFGNNKNGKERQEWWETNKNDIWQGILCALPHSDELKKKEEYKTPPEEFACRPQFLRWFTEWGDRFCIEQTKQLATLQKACQDYECNEENMDEKKKTCEKACKKYQEFINKWKPQYEKQSKKFTKDKEKTEYSKYPSTVNDIEKATDAHEYINRQLQKLCGNGNCKCMEKVSIQSQSKPQEQSKSFDGYDMPASFDKVPEGYENKCNCKPPENKETDSSVNCIDKSAFELKKEAQKSIKDVKKTLSGKTPQIIYEKMNNDSNRNDGTICKIKENGSEQNNICENNGNVFNDINEWECKNEKIKDAKQDICFPPRRKYMCTKPLQNLETKTCTSLNELLNVVLGTAAHEGKHIMDSWNTAKEPKKKTQICDAMKYSFADLGDLIRGRDIYKDDNKEIEDKLQEIFKNICNSNEGKHSIYNDNGDNKYTKLREAWWDTNRKEVWKAMTCSAPEEANIFKDKKNKITNEQERITLYHCGHDSDPPVDDYIPQPFRWMKEWSENYCNAQNNKLSLFGDCENCKKNNQKCKQTKHGSCKKCKKQCEEYNQFVEKWQKQYELLKKSYENIYKKVKENSSKASGETDRNEAHIKNFVEKLQKNCEIDQPKFIDSVDKYLDKGNYCKTVSFQKEASDYKNYAFEKPPKIYKESCECAENFEEVDQCPVDKKHCEKYGTYPCVEKYFNQKPLRWTNDFVKKDVNKYESVIVPPRRRKLCLASGSNYGGSINTKETLKEYIFHSASNEARYLWDIHKKKPQKALTAMKYSFADIGNVVKGDDMLDDIRARNITNIFKKKIIKHKSQTEQFDRVKWWKDNKEKVWNVMMCQYKGKDKTPNSCPKHDNIDKEHQFLRWFQEWTENFCTKRKELYEDVQKICASAECNTSNGSVDITQCIEACEKYKNYILSKEKEYEIQKKKYDTDFKNSQGNTKVHNFLIYNLP
ncbi:hypothetical protein C923_01691 [Plasmodium falciparum UGT5.1]|uniref:Uncharacterized protein n=2 Tax=Plasmodium falciparum TaxID=5833 RepID=W7JF72_PLAFA|nr:hypothetical protein C923_01691 [Plasmodium falciparum UGT5.1]